MASSQFLEEALSTDVDESAVSALVGSLETQLVPNNGITNGAVRPEEAKSLTALQNASTLVLSPNIVSKSGDGVKILTFPANRVCVPNGGDKLVMKAPVSAASPQPSAKPVLSQQTPGTVQILNVNPVRPNQKQMPQQRLVINQQQVIRPGVPGNPAQFTIQGLQPGTSGHILVKTESGQLQLIRVGPPQAPANTPISLAQQSATPPFRVQNVNVPQQGAGTVLVTSSAGATASSSSTLTATSPAARTQVDTTKEKCRKFLANLLELSSREPKAVERNVRTLIQELIDAKVEPEEFCDRLEKLLNASPQPCLIGFLKKSLPLLRQSLFLRTMSIEGIRPPPQHVVGTTVPAVPQLQGQLRGQMVTQTVRVVAPLNAAGQSISVTTPRPGLQQRLVTPIRTQLMGGSGKVVTPMMTSHPPPLQPTSPMVRVAGKTPIRLPTNKAPVRLPTGKPVTVIPASKSLSKVVRGGFDSASFGGDDDINDVAAMGGVNLAEESQRILGSTEFVGTQIRSVKDELFLHSVPLHNKIRQIVASHGLEEVSSEVISLVSHACQERLKTILEKLACIAEHRIDVIKLDPRYEVTQDVKAQLKFLEELDRLERKRHEEQERELLLRAAKSRSKTEDPEQVKLKAKAKEMQRAEMEELRQREANITALQAIGPRKKPRLDMPASSSESMSVTGRSQVALRPRLKRVNLRDLLFLLEQEREPSRTKLLYKSYLK